MTDTKETQIISTAALWAGLSNCLQTIGEVKTRPILDSIQMRNTDAGLTLASTDSFALTTSVIGPRWEALGDDEVLLDCRKEKLHNVTEALRVAKKADKAGGPATVKLTDVGFVVVSDNADVPPIAIDLNDTGRFPEWETLMPVELKTGDAGFGLNPKYLGALSKMIVSSNWGKPKAKQTMKPVVLVHSDGELKPTLWKIDETTILVMPVRSS